MRILVVEDERLLCDGIAEDLELEKYTVDRCYDGADAHERLFVEPYDLVILDLNLPGMDGLELLRRIRSERPELRVLILSARAQLSDKVAGLDLGADDYLTKPFDLEELEARVRTLLRREFVQRAPLVQAGPLALDTVAREISVRGEALPLTPREFAILEHLIRNKGQAHVLCRAPAYSQAIPPHYVEYRTVLLFSLLPRQIHLGNIQTHVLKGQHC